MLKSAVLPSWTVLNQLKIWTFMDMSEFALRSSETVSTYGKLPTYKFKFWSNMQEGTTFILAIATDEEMT
jgi:hypothetical protein